ncbi:MAG: redox-sensitive transcriptional activator SoxR [Actinomycetota bacterium]
MSTTTPLLSVGDVADRCGIAPSAVRYYDDRGLIRSTRTSGGQRRFARDTIRRIAFITAAQAVGRSLDEIEAALDTLPDRRTPTHDDWNRVASSWRPRLDEQIARLEALRDQLDACVGCGCLSLERCAMYNPTDVAARLGPGPRYLMGDRAADVIDDADGDPDR